MPAAGDGSRRDERDPPFDCARLVLESAFVLGEDGSYSKYDKFNKSAYSRTRLKNSPCESNHPRQHRGW
jgi:hypothetical protein